ncbi:MAG: hypothetical protein U9N43_05090 [Euryarchaeota archaeon]|nr:hypothetical protein [Euryarchaeota archaeon]
MPELYRGFIEITSPTVDMMDLKKDFPKIALVIWASSVLLIGVSIHWFMGRPTDMYWAAGLLAFSNILMILLIWYIATKQIKRMDKGEKLAGAVGTLEGKMILAMLIIIVVPAALLFYGSRVAGGPLPIFSFAAFYGGLGGSFLGGSMRKHEIYEKGIDLEVRFVEWEDVVGHEWKDDRLAIMFRGIPKKVTIRDRDGDINRLLEGVYFA